MSGWVEKGGASVSQFVGGPEMSEVPEMILAIYG